MTKYRIPKFKDHHLGIPLQHRNIPKAAVIVSGNSQLYSHFLRGFEAGDYVGLRMTVELHLISSKHAIIKLVKPN